MHSVPSLPKLKPFLLLGSGPRRKFVFVAGRLLDARNGEVLEDLGDGDWCFDPGHWRATRRTDAGSLIVGEDDQGVFVERLGDRRMIIEHPLAMPRFDGHPHAAILRATWHEIATNVVDGLPLPCLWVYNRPWYRDAAMMAMVLELTGHLAWLEPWIARLRDPFDRNNAGAREPDNLGQALFLISRIGDSRHPLTERVLRTAGRITQGGVLQGTTDGRPRPVYQTRWMRFGMRCLGLDPSPWPLPSIDDDYADLFWWDRDEAPPLPLLEIEDSLPWPYLTWARTHARGTEPPRHLLGAAPLTWEARAGWAGYAGMGWVDADYTAARWSAPHTWHAAEVFLLMHERCSESDPAPRT